MRRIVDIRSARVNRAACALISGDVQLTSWRPDKDSDGAGVSVGIIVAGLVVVGVGLVTMHTAFEPLPKPGVPVVISHHAVPVAEAAWRHAPKARPHVSDVSASEIDEAPAPAPAPRVDEPHRADAAPKPAPELPRGAFSSHVSLPGLLATKLTVQQIAMADSPGEKLCKAPTSQVLSAKALQPAMILRYDSKFKAPPLDIEPQRPPSADEERQIKLSALLSNMLKN